MKKHQKYCAFNSVLPVHIVRLVDMDQLLVKMSSKLSHCWEGKRIRISCIAFLLSMKQVLFVSTNPEIFLDARRMKK